MSQGIEPSPGDGDLDKDLVLPKEPQDRYRLRAQRIFATWPQNNTPKEEVLERIRRMDHIESALVCEENHADTDGKHLHAVIVLTQRYSKRGFQELDALAGSHGNYKACRSLPASIRYVMKDGNYAAWNMDLSSYTNQNKKKTPKTTKSTEMAMMIREGGTMDKLDDADPGWTMMNKRKAEEYMAWQAAKKARSSLEKFPQLDPMEYQEGKF